MSAVRVRLINKGYMEERLDILDERGDKTGRSETYAEVHRSGSMHRSVHVLIVNSEGQLLLQKRASNKQAYPNCWDISAAGHISSGETSIEAAREETREELGLDLPVVRFIFLFSIRQPIIQHGEDFTDNEFNDVYLVRHDVPLSDLVLDPSEVADARWVDKSEFTSWLQSGGELVVSHHDEYRRLLENLN